MKWRMEFYNERRGIMAHYSVEALLSADAVRLGWKAVLAEHPPTGRGSRPTSFEQAQRIGGQDASGWVLYRIVRGGEHELPAAAQAHAA